MVFVIGVWRFFKVGEPASLFPLPVLCWLLPPSLVPSPAPLAPPLHSPSLFLPVFYLFWSSWRGESLSAGCLKSFLQIDLANTIPHVTKHWHCFLLCLLPHSHNQLPPPNVFDSFSRYISNSSSALHHHSLCLNSDSHHLFPSLQQLSPPSLPAFSLWF